MEALMLVLSMGVTVPGTSTTKLVADSVEDKVRLEALATELHPDVCSVVAVDTIAIDTASAAAAGAGTFEAGGS
jgi:hypothetical protein